MSLPFLPFSKESTVSPESRLLMLLRHAKAADPHGVPDEARPLSGKGRRNARATREWFVTEGARPDLAITSTATRTRQTWELIGSAWTTDTVPTRIEPRLYGAGPLDLIDIVKRVPEHIRVTVVVGHEPTLSATALLLAGERSDPVPVDNMRRKFPTNGIAVLRFSGRWSELGTGGAVLERFTVPRPEGTHP
jgi:phosphohistidine phosphatase